MGAGYTRELSDAYYLFVVRLTIGMIFILCMPLTLLFTRSHPLVEIILGLLGVSAGIAFVFGLRPKGRLAIRIAAELRAAGYPLNHTPGMQSPQLFAKWMTRNALTAEMIAVVGDKEPPDKPGL